MCSPVEHYFCFYLIFFLYDFEDPRKIVFGVVPRKRYVVSQENRFIFIILVPSQNDNRCPRKSGLSSLYYCLLRLPLCRARCLSFLLKQPDDYLVGKELVLLLFECVVGKMFCCVLCIFLPGLCRCWDFKFNCIDS